MIQNKARAMEAAARVIAVTEEYSGPIPHPSHLRQIADIVPGGADRLIKMAESEQRQRHRSYLIEDFYAYLSLFFGIVGFLACIAGATYLAMHDKNLIAGGMLGVPVVGVIGWFIRARMKSDEPEAQRMPPPAQHKAKQRRARH